VEGEADDVAEACAGGSKCDGGVAQGMGDLPGQIARRQRRAVASYAICPVT